MPIPYSLDSFPKSTLSMLRTINFGWLGLAALLTALIVISPLIAISASVFLADSSSLFAHLWDTVLFEYVTNSILLAVGVGVLTLLLGVPAAWFTSVCTFPGQRTFTWMLLLPLAFPAYIIAYTYTGVLDYAGPVYTLLREVGGKELSDQLFFSIRTVPGAILMLGLVLYPYVYLLTRAAFLEQSVSFLEVSRTLGYSIQEGFFRLAIPLARPAIVTGISLALMETLADYGTVAYFGISTFTTGIFRAFFGFGELSAAAQLSTILMLFVALLIFSERYSRRRASFHETAGRKTHNTRIVLSGRQILWAWVLCLIPVLFGFIIPALILLKWALFDADWVLASFIDLAWHSFELAMLAALIAVALAVLLSYARRQYRERVVHGFVSLAGLGYAIPGAIVAVGVIVPLAWLDHRIIAAVKWLFELEIGLILSGTIFALLFAYTVRFLAISLGTVQSGLDKIKPSMDQAARSLGYRKMEVLGKIHMPLMRASLITAFLIVFVDVLKELPATLILRPFNFNTLAVRAYELASDERLIDAALPSILIVVTGIIPVILLSRTLSVSRQSSS